ncbi:MULTISPECIES: SLC13 family permease [unclassified Motilimonas]|uniref:SLC13 family permease n=1 Tax=unclassified Motilimonas TaxID=2643697 RepID=UPI001E5EE37F|nr:MULTISPECIES: SLC13 family permease [unclassified Motilimonas]MCE0557036.1 SLC13 family permease [Motilimonas sp. E26]MDO6524268.1 SLC13 family permease [Motilimonas sp. 1_MG-2023]
MKLSKKLINTLVCFSVPLLILALPSELMPLPELTLVQHRIIAIFVLAALLWILEPVPVFATSILIITLEVVMVSDKGLNFFSHDSATTPLGELLSYNSIFASFSSPIIILFMGGFALAIAASKFDLDTNLARVLLKPFGRQIHFVMLGLMLITAIFSMFMSNTATTVMMLAILGPIVATAPVGDLGAKGLVLAIPIAANTGGIATPIGTPPNAIALQYLPEGAVTFAQWMMVGLPFVLIQLTLAWFLLRYMYPAKEKELPLKLEGTFLQTPRAWVVYLTFGCTILLWLTTQLHGMNAYVVAIIPLAVFTLTGVINKQDLKLINWDVLWLVAGGIAMGMALDTSGLAVKLASSIDFASMSTWLVIISLSVTCYMMANFMSNTATANLIMPIAAAVATTLPAAAQGGGITQLLMVVAFSSSLGMILPVSTPPNALAYSTGFIETKDLLKSGGIVGIIGLGLMYLGLYLFF